MTATLRRAVIAVTVLAGLVAVNHQAVVLAHALPVLSGHP